VRPGRSSSTADVTAVAVVELVARFDENGDGAISTPELRVAIRVWTSGEISTVLHGVEETVIRGVDR
jgi:hypothetical protein